MDPDIGALRRKDYSHRQLIRIAIAQLGRSRPVPTLQNLKHPLRLLCRRKHLTKLPQTALPPPQPIPLPAPYISIGNFPQLYAHYQSSPNPTQLAKCPGDAARYLLLCALGSKAFALLSRPPPHDHQLKAPKGLFFLLLVLRERPTTPSESPKEPANSLYA